MAPTSLPGQVTQTSPYGRDPKLCGYPVRICEMLSELEGPEYLERVTVTNVNNVRNAKKAMRLHYLSDLGEDLEAEAQLFGDCFETEDQRMAMTAFVEKTEKAPFTGK